MTVTRAITITLKPYLYGLSPREQFNRTIGKIARIMGIHPICNFVAELTTSLNIHYHGWLTYNPKQLIAGTYVAQICALKKKFGHICIKTLKTKEDLERWKNYCRKEVRRTEAIIHSNPEVNMKEKADALLAIDQARRLPFEHLEGQQEGVVVI